MLKDNFSHHRLYDEAVRCWKSNWFSALADQNKIKAVKMLPKLANMSWSFVRRFPKLFIPKAFLPY